MRISEILLEGALSPYQVQHITNADELEWKIREYAGEFIRNNKKTPLYRGRNSDNDYAMIIDPGSGRRYSENTTGHYNYILDGHPEYQSWPKRLNSLICATKKSTADAFGTPYVVLPFDDQPIGVVPYADIWGLNIDLSPFTGKYDLYDLDSLNKAILSRLFPNDTSLRDMIETTSYPEFEEEFIDMFPETTIEAKDFLPYLLDKFRPEKLGMSLENSSNIKVKQLGDKEVWFSNPAFIINVDLYSKLLI